MTKYNRILYNDDFNVLLQRLGTLESSRRFCRHGFSHLTDVCRIAYIIALENNLGLDKDIIYGAGLLHDIGRVAEYENGLPHNEQSAEAARTILKECEYNEDEIETICQAIMCHRSDSELEKALQKPDLAAVLKKADRLSRNCFYCPVCNECKWSENQRNKGIV
jgi:uncharacterized protein